MAKIPVPSNWEQHGFGAYNFGRPHDEQKNPVARERGKYRLRFFVPAGWRGRVVRIVFDGVMTDAEVSVNGRSAGPTHQGSFYQFKYDITPLLKYGAENQLEVNVSKISSNESVNRAERFGSDYWVFGGIFRPVYLEALPPPTSTARPSTRAPTAVFPLTCTSAVTSRTAGCRRKSVHYNGALKRARWRVSHGTRLDVWESRYNDTTPGESWGYPEFKGYFAGWRWAAFETTAGSVTFINKSSDSHLGVFKPKDGRDGLLDLPETGLAILHVVPAIGSKFQPPDQLGPQSQQRHVSGTTRGSISFSFNATSKRTR